MNTGKATAGIQSAHYYPAIDGLRAVAVMSVLLYHLSAHILPGGFVGVDVFFVISGFVVCNSVLQMRRDIRFGELCAQFYARRVLRIGPALVVCLLVTGVIATLFIPQTWLSQVNNKTAFAAFFGLANFVLYDSAGDYFSPRAEYNPFTHTWSLAVEEQFYLIFPALIFGAAFVKSQRWRHVTLLGLVTLVLASLWLCAIWTPTNPAKAFYLLPARYWELGAGVLACLACQRLQARGTLCPQGQASLAQQGLTIAAAATLLFSLFSAQHTAFPYPWALVPVLSTTALVMLLTGPSTWVAKLLSSAPFMWIGLRSYSIYLWHWPVFILLKWTVGLDSSRPDVMAGAAVLAVALGALSYRYVETPIRTSPPIKRLPRVRVIVAGLSAVTAMALLTGLVFKARGHLSLSVTADEKTWFPYEKEDVKPTSTQCAIRRTTSPLGPWGGEVIQLEPIDCSVPHKGRLFVAGDSHATAYSLMLRRFASETGTPVTIYTLPNCPFLTLQKPNREQKKDCAEFVVAAVKDITARATPADTAFFAALRVPRLSNQHRRESADLSQTLNAPQKDRGPAVAEAAQLLAPLAATGARLVFEAPKPVSPSPTFRCADWFNRMNPVCIDGPSVPAVQMAAYLEPAREALTQLVRMTGKGEIWDPGHLFCDAKQCSAYKDGKPLIFDGDHISGHANELLLPEFKRIMSGQSPQLHTSSVDRTSQLQTH